MKGSKFLKVTGILMIIGGSIGIIAGIIAVIGVGALAALLGVGSGLLTASAVLCLVSGICSLIAGIVGVKNCKNAAASKKCIVWGILVAVLSLTGNILGVVAGSDFNVFNALIGLVLPVLYIIGAAMNGKEA